MIPFGEAPSMGAPQLLSRRDLIVIILRLQFDGWRIALGEAALDAKKDEPHMNGRLFQGMVTMRSRLGLTNLFLVETPGVRVNPEPSRPEAAPDLILLFAEFGANEPHAIVECKRLDPFEQPRNLRGEYVRSGIDRFIAGTYGPNHELDFMVAFVLRGNGTDAMTDVNDYLSNVGRQAESLGPADEFTSENFVARSNHHRSTDGSGIGLLHSFLVFPEDRALSR